MDRVHVFGNPAARGGREHLEAVVAGLARRRVESVVHEAESVAGASAAARDAVEDGADRLVCVGGDGVVRLAVDAAATTTTTIGIVPHGTGNDFARAIGLLDGDLDRHLDRALADPVAVDAIRTRHGWVASVATIGFSGDVTARANGLRWPRGRHRYTVATLLQLPRLRTLALEIEIDGQSIEADSTLLSVGNTAYFGGGMRICPAARPADGLLQVVVIGDVPRSTFVRVFPQVFSGRHVRHGSVTVHVASAVTVTGDAVDVWADGDLLGPLPVSFEVVPGALRVAGATV